MQAHTKLARRPRANKIAHKNEFIWVVHMCTAGQDNGLIYNADTKLANSVILGCVRGDLHAEKFHVRYIAMWSASCSGSIKDILAAAETFQLGDMEHPANP